MRSIYITLLGIFFASSLFAAHSFDTTYTKEWNNHNESWTYFDRIISEYQNGEVVCELIQVYENENWVNYNKTSFYYNNGNIIEELERFWDDRNERWVKNYRKLYSYNNGLVSQIAHQYIFNGIYVNSQREIMKYNDKGTTRGKKPSRSLKKHGPIS